MIRKKKKKKSQKGGYGQKFHTWLVLENMKDTDSFKGL